MYSLQFYSATCYRYFMQAARISSDTTDSAGKGLCSHEVNSCGGIPLGYPPVGCLA